MITLAVDFGGQRIKLGVVQDGQVSVREILPAHAEQPLKDRLAVVSKSLHSICIQNHIGIRRCEGIGISYPSVIDVSKARIMDHFGKFGNASSIDLQAWAREAFGLPLAIENDARMAMIGEWQYGAGMGRQNLVMITLGTGLGVSAIVDGHILRGEHGQASILGGHLTVRYGGQHCVCGNLGCAEVEASTSVLGQLARNDPLFSLSPLAREPEINYAAVFRWASQGDACAIHLREHSLQVWSTLAVNLIHAYDPETLILGGGVMGSADIILPAIINYTNAHAHTPWGKVQILSSKRGDDAALLAAEWLVKTQSCK